MSWLHAERQKASGLDADHNVREASQADRNHVGGGNGKLLCKASLPASRKNMQRGLTSRH